MAIWAGTSLPKLIDMRQDFLTEVIAFAGWRSQERADIILARWFCMRETDKSSKMGQVRQARSTDRDEGYQVDHRGYLAGGRLKGHLRFHLKQCQGPFWKMGIFSHITLTLCFNNSDMICFFTQIEHFSLLWYCPTSKLNSKLVIPDNDTSNLRQI